MKSPLSRVTILSLSVGAVVGFATCRVSLGDGVTYTCSNDNDCGGGGYKCALGPSRGTCCLPSGDDDQCDQIDNDCDGRVDNTGKPELCNGLDDDCNGRTDELYDLTADPNNCGKCKVVCAVQEPCVKGMCIPRKEIDCFDSLDNDENGKTDCDDPSCEKRQCGAACLCEGLKKTETLCSDGTGLDGGGDNDGDLTVDCLDTDCLGKECRIGCTCIVDGGQSETGCTDGVDNDGDAKIDCFDTDCVGRFCTPPQLYFTCTTDEKCKCNGTVQVGEFGSVFCRDNLDNDCNGVTDCAETSCSGQNCSLDGGVGTCECAMGKAAEKACGNLHDDDADQLIDCADSDCLAKPCNLDGGLCNAAQGCE